MVQKSLPNSHIFLRRKKFISPKVKKPINKSAVPVKIQILTHDISTTDALAVFLIKIGLVFVFTYAAISMSLDPKSYVHYIPPFARELYNPIIQLHAFAVFEILISLWLLSGKRKLYAAIMAFITIFGLTIINIASFSVVFRNVSIICSAFALVLIYWHGYKEKNQ